MTRAAVLLFALAAIAGCRERAEPEPGQAREPAPREVRLRHGFRPGLELRYESSTVERGAAEVTIEMRTRWHVAQVDRDGAAELGVVIERYEQRAFHAPAPAPSQVPPEVSALNRGLEGARFVLRASADGRRVEHVGHEGVPEALSRPAVAAIEASLASHLLKLPVEPVHAGERWTVEAPSKAGGAARALSRSQWRVLSVMPRDGRDTFVELVCLATMEPEPQVVAGRRVTLRTSFHYDYLWNATEGVLDSVSSTGSTTTTTEPVADAGAPADGGAAPAPGRVTFEARLRLLRGGPGAR